MRRLICAILCVLPLLFGASLAQAEKRVALVIGNSAYRQVAALANPANDASDMAAALKALGFDVIEGHDLTQADMLATIRRFTEALRGADAGLLYYAGHGLEVGNTNYLVPIDAKLANEGDLAFEAVKLDLVLEQLEREAKTALVFLDACRDNPMAQILARSMGTRSASIGRGLARVESGLGTFIAFATQPGNVALDGVGRNSPFTSALVRHIGEPGRDLSAFMIAVRNDVYEATEGKQWPWDNSSLRTQFFFKPGETASTPSASSPPTASDPAADAWKAAESSADTAVLEAFIAKFGDSFYASLAEARLAQLRRTDEERKIAVVAAPPKPASASTRKVGDNFKDCEQCPEMLVLPAGEFAMGSKQDKDNRNQNERPQHSVNIAAPFAVGIFEVTKDQFETFVSDSGHDAGSECLTYEENSPEIRSDRSFRHPGFMQDTTEPASCINWHDAKAYVAWLSQKTGQSYRLLSEAEWEYAARGGSQLRLVSAKGDRDLCQHANIADRTAKVIFVDWNVTNCSDDYIHTSPVGSYTANGFGLYDMLGNVAEWVEDCWHSNYAGAPTDGSVWTSRADCSYRMVRGGSWLGFADTLGVANRSSYVPDDRDAGVGFRVARDLGS